MIDDMDMSEVLTCFLQPVTLKTVTVTSVDFVDTTTVTTQSIQAVVQPADKDKLNADNIDWSLEYQTIHSKSQLLEGQYAEYAGKDFKIISVMPYGDYGYFEAVGEETKRDLL
jgi:hypothetical protein